MRPGPILTTAAMREADRRTIADGRSGFELMRAAGAAVAREAGSMLPSSGRVLVLCGPGNNGGDGFLAAVLLAEAGHSVTVASLARPTSLSGDAGLAAAAWSGPVLDLSEADPQTADLIIDALFGTGLARDLDGAAAAVIARVNGSGRPVLAVDVPSGIDADTGAVRGVAVRADRTIVLAAAKPGHWLQPGRAHAGAVTVAEIGISAATLAELAGPLVVNDPQLWRARLPQPAAGGHKYDRGHALVLSGGPSRTGAARLAARGALRAGAGLVTLATTARALAVNAGHLTAVMLAVANEPDELADLLTDERYNAIALGPGLGVGDATRAWVGAALEADRATVLDADALTSFAGDAEGLRTLLLGRERDVVLTPHDGEFRRLFSAGDESAAQPGGIAAAPSKLDRAMRAAEFTGAVCVLKGPDTVVAAPDGRVAVNVNGSPHLATAGSGDVLTGMIAGLMAQGMPGFEAACAAVWMHADAAERFGPGLVSEDLPEMLPPVWRDLLKRVASPSSEDRRSALSG